MVGIVIIAAATCLAVVTCFPPPQDRNNDVHRVKSVTEEIMINQLMNCTEEKINNDCGLAGVWKNQLKSVMKFACKDGRIWGTYNSNVGTQGEKFPMTGRYVITKTKDVTLGWVVSYVSELKNYGSTAAWSGKHYKGEGILRTLWLLTGDVDKENYWQSTHVNHDEFYRLPCLSTLK